MRAVALLALLLAACSPGKLDWGIEDLEPPSEDIVPEGTLRLDIDPPDIVADRILLPQSHIVPPSEYVDLGIPLFETRMASGVLTAQVVRGWSLGAPTSTEPIVANILALPEDDRIGAIAQSNPDGSFSISWPAYPGSTRLAFVPSDATLAPFLIVNAPGSDRPSFDQEIPAGIPVYGRVTGLVGGVEQPLPGIPLRISRTIGGQRISSAVFSTDESGWYVARVDQLGEYTLEVVGGAFGTVTELAPSVELPVLVENTDGVLLSPAVGVVTHATVDGRVVDKDGYAVGEDSVTVRFTSTSLDGGVGTYTWETDTQENGRVFGDLLPGVYDVDVIPKYMDGAVSASPVRYPNVRIDDGVDLGQFQLAAPARLTGTVLDISESPAPNVQVVATELGYGQHVYYGRTGQDGTFDFPVSDVPMHVTLTPSDSSAGAVTHTEIEAPSTITSFQLDEGVPVSGQVTFDGVEVETASVKVYDASSGALLGQTFSDDTGYFSLRVSLPEPSRETELDPDDTGAEDTGADTGPSDTGPSDTASTEDTSAEDTSGADTADTAR